MICEQMWTNKMPDLNCMVKVQKIQNDIKIWDSYKLCVPHLEVTFWYVSFSRVWSNTKKKNVRLYDEFNHA